MNECHVHRTSCGDYAQNYPQRQVFAAYCASNTCLIAAWHAFVVAAGPRGGRTDQIPQGYSRRAAHRRGRPDQRPGASEHPVVLRSRKVPAAGSRSHARSIRQALSNKPASRGPKILDFDLCGAISGFPQIVRQLKAQPHLRAGAECFGQTDRHLDGDSRFLVDEIGQRLASHAETVCRSCYR